jgi:hypothetical protein
MHPFLARSDQDPDFAELLPRLAALFLAVGVKMFEGDQAPQHISSGCALIEKRVNLQWAELDQAEPKLRDESPSPSPSPNHHPLRHPLFHQSSDGIRCKRRFNLRA